MIQAGMASVHPFQYTHLALSSEARQIAIIPPETIIWASTIK
jgi:hypothetical protein